MKEAPETQLTVGSDQVDSIQHEAGQDVMINLTGTIQSLTDTGAVIGNVVINECEAAGEEVEEYPEETEEKPMPKGGMPKAIAIIMTAKKNAKK